MKKRMRQELVALLEGSKSPPRLKDIPGPIALVFKDGEVFVSPGTYIEWDENYPEKDIATRETWGLRILQDFAAWAATDQGWPAHTVAVAGNPPTAILPIEDESTTSGADTINLADATKLVRAYGAKRGFTIHRRG